MKKTVTEEATFCDECGHRMVSEIPQPCEMPGCQKEMHLGCAVVLSAKYVESDGNHRQREEKAKITCREHAQPFIDMLDKLTEGHKE